MMRRTHVVLGASGGALCAMAAHPFTSPGMALLCIPVGALFGPAADVDHHNAPARAAVAPAVLVLVLLGWLYRFGCWVVNREPHLADTVRVFFHHRNGTHRITSALLFGAFLAATLSLAPVPELRAHGWAVGAAAAAGWLSHIYGDARTHSGVPVGQWEGCTFGRTVRTGSRCRGCAVQAANRRRRGRRRAVPRHEVGSEQHLYSRRFVPAAWVLSAAAVLLAVPPLA